MTKERDEPIGAIECPKCDREARVLQFAERTKVTPDQDGGRSYPRKLYIDCPHLDDEDERCGVTRMDSKAGQAWILKNARMPGTAKKTASSSSSSRSSSTSPQSKPSAPAAPDPAVSRVTPARTAPDPPASTAQKKRSWMDELI